MNNIRNTLAFNLKNIKKEHSFTQFDIAELSGLSVREIGKVERAQVGITIDSLEKLAKGLGISAYELLREM